MQGQPQQDAGGGQDVSNMSATRDIAGGPGGLAVEEPPKTFLSTRKMWNRVEFSTSLVPCPRSGAASVVHEGKLLMYGGYGGSQRLDDLWSFDFETRSWEQILYTGGGPGARENNGVVVVDNVLYLFGGFNGFQWLGDFHGFDLRKKKWTRIEDRGTVPLPRFGYVSATYCKGTRKELILFAG